MAAKNNEIQLTRIYDAPVKTVWEAWTDPKQVAKWWGPRGFTLTTHSKDLRPGGHWHYTMHGPDGVNYPNKTVYHEVEKYSRLVYDHGGNDEQKPLFRVTVLFSDLGGRTRMEMTMALKTAEEAAQTKKFIRKANGESTWDRLAEYLEKEASGTDQFVINRTFETDLETMFKMWTDPEHFSRWLPPTGLKMKFLKADIRTGGETFFSMGNDSGFEMFGRTEYLEVTPPSRIVYLQQFCDKDRKLSRHPHAPTWPETMHTTVTLTEEQPGLTRVMMVWRPQGKVTAEELQAFIAEKPGMTQGWSGSFDKLEALLA